jgi:tetratricopeptide (TPR) repeat protein
VRPALRPNRAEPAVAAAYAALWRGDLAAAERGYRAAAAGDATNIDALLGLAYIVGQRGDRAQALQHYRAVLALEPSHSAARAGVAALVTPDRPALAQEESALRAELTRWSGSAPNPLAAPLHSALGGVLAGEGRWNEAQAAYYEAFRADAENPDTLYNLAVSLDQLKQPKLAADFYTRALAAAKLRPAQFDAAAASRRLAEIQ